MTTGGDGMLPKPSFWLLPLLLSCVPRGARAQVNCRMSAWGGWGPCDRSCGGGRQQAFRRVEQRAAYGGAPCPRALKRLRDCRTARCHGARAPSSEFKDPVPFAFGAEGEPAPPPQQQQQWQQPPQHGRHGQPAAKAAAKAAATPAPTPHFEIQPGSGALRICGGRTGLATRWLPYEGNGGGRGARKVGIIYVDVDTVHCDFSVFDSSPAYVASVAVTSTFSYFYLLTHSLTPLLPCCKRIGTWRPSRRARGRTAARTRWWARCCSRRPRRTASACT